MVKLSVEQKKELKLAFEALDENKDGVISKKELSTLLFKLGDEIDDNVVD